jgi:CubicO group peptidase (beta-lactamase class C family)
VNSETDTIRNYFENDYAPPTGWDARSDQVEIRHLLSMMSGYDCDDLATGFACEDAMYRTDDWVQYALDLPFAHDPGQQWAYNSSSLILVGEAISKGSGMPLDEFAERYLFEPLEIRRFRWNTSPKGRAWIGGGARMTPREMAKTGQLMLNRGLWNGDRILSEEWIDKSTAKQGEMPGSGVDYGYLWQAGEAVLGERMIPAYWASGNGGQYIIVLPEDGMVVVFTGGNYDSPLADQPFRMLVNNIVPAFLPSEAPDELALTSDELQRLVGVYELDFERSATSTITVHDGRLRILSPDRESLDLIARSPNQFIGDSRYGPLTLIFEANGDGEVVSFMAYATFSRFRFERR